MSKNLASDIEKECEGEREVERDSNAVVEPLLQTNVRQRALREAQICIEQPGFLHG